MATPKERFFLFCFQYYLSLEPVPFFLLEHVYRLMVAIVTRCEVISSVKFNNVLIVYIVLV